MHSFSLNRQVWWFSFALLSIIKFVGSETFSYLSHEEHSRYKAFLEKEIKKEYPSDGDDKAEVVVQEPAVVQGADVTFYKFKGKTVFVSVGKKNVGKDVILLLRGADYMDPTNKERFVVLRKRGSGSEYNVHVVVIWSDMKKALHAVWQDAAISMLPDLGVVLNYLTQPYDLVEPYEKGSIRPRCGWFGFVLLCESSEMLVGDAKGGEGGKGNEKEKEDEKSPTPPENTGSGDAETGDKGSGGSSNGEGNGKDGQKEKDNEVVKGGAKGGNEGAGAGDDDEESSEEHMFVVHKAASQPKGTIVTRPKPKSR